MNNLKLGSYLSIDLSFFLVQHISQSDSTKHECFSLPRRGARLQLFFLEVAFEEGSGDVVIVFFGDRTALSLVSVLEGVLLFDGCWREGDPVCKR